MVDTHEFASHCHELLSVLGRARTRRMFGGHGIYVDDLFIALIINEVLYLKADELARPAFESAGGQPFSYATATGNRTVLAYWTAPDDAMESPPQMLPWARLAMASALRAAAAKKPAAPRKPSAKTLRAKPGTGAKTPAKRPGDAGAKPVAKRAAKSAGKS